MKFIYSLIRSVPVALAISSLLAACSSGGGGGTVNAKSLLPLAASPVQGATLSGSLAGKQLFLLGGSLNRSKCWQDSEYWDGHTLWYAVTNTNWTQLAAASTFAADPGCTLASEHTGVLFNVYGATPDGNGDWTYVHPGFNSASANIAAPKLSGSTMVAVVYEKTSSFGNIYFTTRTGTNSWSTPTAFSQNSTSCNDDNPMIYANGTKMIFESSRSAAAVGSSCTGHQKLWYSTLSGGSWSTPVALGGGPTLGASATQPWLDESNGKLYWTADNTNADVCPTNAANCVVEADLASGLNYSNTLNLIIAPSPFLSIADSDGKLLLVGQYTVANGFAVASCGIASYSATANSNLLGSHLAIYYYACAVPLNQ